MSKAKIKGETEGEGAGAREGRGEGEREGEKKREREWEGVREKGEKEPGKGGRGMGPFRLVFPPPQRNFQCPKNDLPPSPEKGLKGVRQAFRPDEIRFARPSAMG